MNRVFPDSGLITSAAYFVVGAVIYVFKRGPALLRVCSHAMS